MKKKIALLLALATVFSFSACSTKTPPVSDDPVDPPAVDPVDPTPDDKEPTAEEISDEYRVATDGRIEQIRSTPNKSTDGATVVYYVSNTGNDSNDGLTEATAWKTLNKVNSVSFERGTYVCFERGGLWRGKIKAKSGVTYTAYGEGDKPLIYGSPENGANANKWVQTDTENVWKYVEKFTEDVGTIVFDEGEEFGVKATIACHNNVYYNMTRYKNNEKGDKDSTGAEPWGGIEDLEDDLEFWHNDVTWSGNTADNYLYVYSEENPGERFWSIEFNVKHHLMEIDSYVTNVTVDNLAFKYGGGHGISAVETSNLTVENCEFGWIGGSLQTATPSSAVRYGNAIQTWLAVDGYKANNNYIYQIYDAGITPQGNLNQSEFIDMTNIEFDGNVIENCNYGIECFVTASATNDSHFSNVTISNNHIWYSGYGLCEQRNDPYDTSHIYFWRGTNKNKMTEYVQIKNNVLAYSRIYTVSTQFGAAGSQYAETSGFNYDGNVFIDYLSEDDSENIDNTAIGWGGYEFGNGKVFGVCREWIDGANRWKSYYDDLCFYDEGFVEWINGFKSSETATDNTCVFVERTANA